MDTNSRKQTRSVSYRGTDGFLSPRRDFTMTRSQHLVQPQAIVLGVQPKAAPPQLPKPLATQVSKAIQTEQSWQSPIPSANVTDQIPRFDLPRYEPPDRPAMIVRKRGLWMKRIFKATAMSSAVLLMLGGVLFWRGYSNIHKVFRGTTTVAALSTGYVAPELLKGEGDGRVNILLLGVGGKNHDGGDLTDTMLVLSVDPVNTKAAMLSVPRDLWVKMPVNYFGAYQKLNAAYSSGKYKYLGKTDLGSDNQQAVDAGFSAVDEAVSSVLGININYHVLVNFAAFEQAIDTVNGVTLEVTEQLYDPTMAWENANNPVLAPVGVQRMDGKKALMYARSRETSSDFARSERQRQLLIALKQKVLTLGTLSSPGRIDGLMNAFGNNVHTDLSTKAASRLYSIMKGIKDDDIASLSLTTPVSLVTTDRVGSASVVRPKAGFNAYSDIQLYVKSQLPDGYIVKEKANVYVVGATEPLRAHTVTTLTGAGYIISGSSVATGVTHGTTIVASSGSKKPYTLHYLQDRYGVAAQASLPTGLQVPEGTDFVIIAGI